MWGLGSALQVCVWVSVQLPHLASDLLKGRGGVPECGSLTTTQIRSGTYSTPLRSALCLQQH